MGAAARALYYFNTLIVSHVLRCSTWNWIRTRMECCHRRSCVVSMVDLSRQCFAHACLRKSTLMGESLISRCVGSHRQRWEVFQHRLCKRRQAFLEFVLAVEYRGTPQSLRYMFRLFDVTKRGLLVRADVRYFMRAVLDKHGTSRALCSPFLKCNPRTVRGLPRPCRLQHQRGTIGWS